MQSLSRSVNPCLPARRWVLWLLLGALALQGFTSQVSVLQGPRAHLHSGVEGAWLKAVLRPLQAAAAWLPVHDHHHRAILQAHGWGLRVQGGPAARAAHADAHARGLAHHHDASEADVITLDDGGTDSGTASTCAFLALLPPGGPHWARCRGRDFAHAEAVARWRDHLRAPPLAPPRRG